jgi:two-component system nitrate/nitrite response regulator NarL
VQIVKILVLAEIRLYREAVADVLRRLPDVSWTSTAATGSAAIIAARQDECDVVLVDMSLPDIAATVQTLLSTRPSLKVVALGVPEDGPEVIACAEAGISGYVSREASLAELRDGLRRVLKGEAAVSGRVAAGLIRYIHRHAPPLAPDAIPRQLTPRERDILRLLEMGMSNKEVARALDLQLSTVKNHVHSLLTKSGATGRDDIGGALRRAGNSSPGG